MSKSNTLHIAKALAALTDKSEKHKQAVNGTELIKVLEQKLQDYQTLCQEERECFIELLYSIVDNNSLAAQKCQDLSVEQTIINILRGEVESNSFNEHLFKMLLKIL